MPSVLSYVTVTLTATLLPASSEIVILHDPAPVAQTVKVALVPPGTTVATAGLLDAAVQWVVPVCVTVSVELWSTAGNEKTLGLTVNGSETNASHPSPTLHALQTAAGVTAN